MNRQPVNPDDLELTAYALGEMSHSERIDFEARLKSSPEASAELESMDEMMSLLSGALKDEWCVEMKEPALEVLPPAEESKVVVPFEFRKSKRAVAAVAAAVAAMLLAGAALLPKADQEHQLVSVPAGSSGIAEFASVSGDVSVPHLYSTEEVQNPNNLDLVAALESLDQLHSPVDASYLDSNASGAVGSSVIVPASMTERMDGGRVDSYLPLENLIAAGSRMKTGLIERRTMISGVEGAGAENNSRAFLRGYVAMDGGTSSPGVQAGSGRVLAGFRPVSMIGNPVEDLEVDLRLISDFQSIQGDFSRIVAELPEGSQIRNDLSELLERNRKAVTELKREFSR